MENMVFSIIGIVMATSILLVIIKVVVSSPGDSAFNPSNVFSELCASTDYSVIVQDFSYGQKTAFVQIFLDDSQDINLIYPRNTFSIISGLYNENEYDLEEKISNYPDLTDEKNPSSIKELSKCFGKSCFCKVETGYEAEFINFDNMDWTWCFPLLYSEARNAFDTKFNELNDGSKDLDLFKEVVDTLIEDWRIQEEYGGVVECYDFVRNFEFTYEGVSGEYFITLSRYGEDLLASEDINFVYDALKELYSTSKVGYFPIIHECTIIPEKNNCLCETDVNILIHKRTVADYVFFGMCGSRSSFNKAMNFEEIYFSKTAEKFSCKIEIN